MCLQNLPVEFDDDGRAYLRSTNGEDPWSLDAARPRVDETDEDREERIRRLVEQNRRIRRANMDPVSRVAGSLGIYVVADLDEGRHLDCRAEAPLFRGYEVLAMGRDARDAIFITSRVCGVCGGVHSHAAAYAIEMALGIEVPPMGTVVRNLQEAAEMMMDNALHLTILAGPDYSELVVKATTPALWEKAKTWKCPTANIHKKQTMAEVMEGFNPLTGDWYRMGLQMNRVGKEMFSLLQGKYPHPQAIVPGGVSTTLTFETLNEYHTRLSFLIDNTRVLIALYDDIRDFFYEADERYKLVGQRPMNMLDTGYWDDPFAYDSTYENCNEWGEKRWSTPGVILDGELVTTRLTDINLGLEEFVDHSYYEQWSGQKYDTDMLGNPISPFHPWNERTLPKPEAKNFKEKYTWSKAPRWDRNVMEAGPYARLWITALAQKQPTNEFMEPTGTSLRLYAPQAMHPEGEHEWHIPDVWNAFERNRGRAYHLYMSRLVALANLMEAYRLYHKGIRDVAALDAWQLGKLVNRKTEEVRGVGWWGAGRGYLSHHCVLESGKIVNYQVLTPSAWNASPRDAWDQPGPYEEAVMATPIIEEYTDEKEFTSIDMMRAVRSFDPCMPCTVHVDTGGGTVVREVNTCECGA